MTIADIFNNAIEHWRMNKGIGTALIPHPLNDKFIVLGVLQRLYASSPTAKTIIIVSSFSERIDMIEFLITQNADEENNVEFKELIDNKRIIILTDNYISDVNNKHNTNVKSSLCIVYRPDSICNNVERLLNVCKFKLIVLNKLILDSKTMALIYKIAPLLSDFKQAELEEVRLSTPVEETQIGIDIVENSEEAKLLKYYNEYISTSINIFGSFDIINQANRGNTSLNISSMQICSQIAQENGWNDHLDMSVEFNVEIDKLYNPMNLKDRASNTYEIIRNRSQLLSDYTLKLDAIYEIVRLNPNKKILIINKRADFASKVTEFINTMSNDVVCLNYHDKMEPIPALDNKNKPILYSTGNKKGQPKMLGSQAQRTYAIDKFNKGSINILSTNNSPDKSLNVEVDIIIITSPQCNDLKSYLYRLTHLNFLNNNIYLYSLYCKDTQEQKLLEDKTFANNHVIKHYSDDESFSDFVIAD